MRARPFSTRARLAGLLFAGLTIATSADLSTAGAAEPAPRPGPSALTTVPTPLPPNAAIALVNLTMTDATGPGYLSAGVCSRMSAEPQSASNANFDAGQNIANLAVVLTNFENRFCLYPSASTHLVADLLGYFAMVGGYGLDSVEPVRVLDTRSGPRPSAGSITRVETGAPPGTELVLANITMTGATNPGYITAAPCSKLAAGPQNHSNGNYTAGRDIANLAVVAVDADGSFCIFTEAPAHLLVDIQGLFNATSTTGIIARTPDRRLDTRQRGHLAAGDIVMVDTGALPDAESVLVNLTMTNADEPGYITAMPCSLMEEGPQTRSSGNYVPNSTIANLAIVPIDSDGTFCLYTQSGVDILVDVQGAFAPPIGSLSPSLFTPVDPTRLFDSRRAS